MVRSRYPRQGQKLAPAALRELLQIPVPPEYIARPEDAGILLSDLDETAWQRFDQHTCRLLGNKIVEAIGFAIRTPGLIESRLLPLMPEGGTLADLKLETRTANCLVAAGMHERLKDLSGMTVGGVLALQGFWAKCLVDLMVSIEELIEHPEKCSSTLPSHAAAGKQIHPGYRYPHPGRRLAPNMLREALRVDIPHNITCNGPWQGAQLCDLDESAWSHFSPTAIARLAELIIEHAAHATRHKVIRDRRLPALPPGVRLEDLCLENRTYHCLSRDGYVEEPERLGELSVHRLMSIRAFGAKCLVDLLTAIESRAAREGRLDKELTRAAEQLIATAGTAGITFADPRLGTSLRAMDTESNTLGEMCQRLQNRRSDPPDPHGLAKQLRDLHETLRRLFGLSVEDELLDIFAPGASERDRRIVAEYFGWDGKGERTLEQLGDHYGLSRERIRQVCIRATRHGSDCAVFAPALDRALSYLAARVPAAYGRLQAEFDAKGFSACRLPIESLMHAADLLKRPVPLAVADAGGNRVAVPPSMADLPAAILRIASRPVTLMGIGSVSDLMEVLAEKEDKPIPANLIRATLEAANPGCWLDTQREWFWVASGAQAALPGALERVLAVTSRIDIHDLLQALMRQRRLRSALIPPAKILLEFCRRVPGIRVRGRWVRAAAPINLETALSGIERQMAAILMQHGPILDRNEFEELAAEQGVNRFSFNSVLLNSPIMRCFARGIYALAGTAADASAIEAASKRLHPPNPLRVLQGFGRKKDGTTFLAYRLSRAAIACGVVTVPVAMRPHLQETYALRSADGRKLGTLVTKDGCGWGIGPALRTEHAREGDHILLLIDTARGEAQLCIGDESLLKDLPLD